MFPEIGNWYAIKDGDGRGRAILNRHYSARHYKDGRHPKLFVGPGEKLILMTTDCKALFVWRKFIDDSGQKGINCAVFRNEGDILSSTLILEAEQIAWARWPGERLYTYINSEKTQKRRGKNHDPGYCFLCAGWRYAGETKTGLIILEKEGEHEEL